MFFAKMKIIIISWLNIASIELGVPFIILVFCYQEPYPYFLKIDNCSISAVIAFHFLLLSL